MSPNRAGTPNDTRPGERDASSLGPDKIRFIGESYRLLFEKNPLPMWVFDVKTLRFLAVNEAAVNHYGYSRDEFLRLTVRDIRPPEDLPALDRELEHLDSRTESIGIWRHRKKDGTVIDAEVRSNEIDFTNHRARLVLAYDITERLRIERNLRTGYAASRILDSANSFRDAAPKILQAVCEQAGWEYGELWRADPDRNALRWDGAWRIVGFPSEELERASAIVLVQRGIGIPGRTWATGRPEWHTDLTPQANFSRVEPVARLGLRQALSFPIRGRASRVLGVLVFFSRSVGEPDEAFLDLMTDLGNRMGLFLEAERAETERLRAQERFSKAFHEAPTAAAITRLSDGTIIDVNESFLRAYESTRDEIVGRPSRDLDLWADPEQRERILGPVRRGESVRGTEERFRTKSGRTWTALVFVAPITLADEPTILTTLVDVTKLREAEQQLIESERLASIGRTANFVAHELNTPLTNIALTTALMRRQTEEAAVRERLDRIDAQRRLASRIIEEVMTFTHATAIQRSETNLAELIRDATEEAEAFRKDGVSLVLKLPDRPMLMSVDPLKMSQAVVNLVKNAYQATDEGRVDVSLAVEGDKVRLSVSDSGKGITPEQRERLFQPFFTTKPHGEGVGLGLSFVKAVVEAHGGAINVVAEPGGGSRFTISLPVEASPSNGASAAD